MHAAPVYPEPKACWPTDQTATVKSLQLDRALYLTPSVGLVIPGKAVAQRGVAQRNAGYDWATRNHADAPVRYMAVRWHKVLNPVFVCRQILSATADQLYSLFEACLNRRKKARAPAAARSVPLSAVEPPRTETRNSKEGLNLQTDDYNKDKYTKLEPPTFPCSLVFVHAVYLRPTGLGGAQRPTADLASSSVCGGAAKASGKRPQRKRVL